MDPAYHFRTLLMGIHRLLDSRILLHYNVAMLEDLIQSIPAEPGSYLLWLGLPGELELSVGQLGAFRFPAGDYLYLGSAHGPGGLRARLGRHLRGDGKTHWHIDYLREAVSVHAVGWQKAAKGLPGRLECSWSRGTGRAAEYYRASPWFWGQ